MEPHEADTLIRHLIAIAAHQDVINQRLTLAIESIDRSIERIDLSIERIEATLQALLDLLARRDNGRQA